MQVDVDWQRNDGVRSTTVLSKLLCLVSSRATTVGVLVPYEVHCGALRMLDSKTKLVAEASQASKPGSVTHNSEQNTVQYCTVLYCTVLYSTEQDFFESEPLRPSADVTWVRHFKVSVPMLTCSSTILLGTHSIWEFLSKSTVVE